MGSFAFIYPLHKRRRNERFQAILAERNSELSMKKRLQIEKEEASSIFAHPRTPYWAKFLLPFFCFMNVFLLILAVAFSDALNLVISFSIAGVSTNEIVLVPFTMIRLINDMWNSGAWPLSLLLIMASCAWPVIKNCTMMLVWFLPTTLLKADHRVAILQWLDVLGKWSFLEAFVVVAAIGGLKTVVDLSTQERLNFISESLLISEVELIPERGMTLLAFVASFSLVLNHIMSIYHHKVVEQVLYNENVIKGIPNTPKSISKERQQVRNASVKLHGLKKVSPKAVKRLIITIFTFWLFVVLGVTLPVVTYGGFKRDY